MAKYKDIPLAGGGFERVHLGSDGRLNGRREFINNDNWKTKAEMDAFHESVYGPTRNKCTCGGTYQPHSYETRASSNWLGIGRKGTVNNAVKCDSCGRVNHV